MFIFYFFILFFFFFNDTATTEIYTLSLHDALPISYGFNLCEIYLNTLYIESDYKKVMQDFIILRKLFEDMSDYEYERYIITPVSENIVLLELKFKLDAMRYNLCIYLPFDMLPSEFKSEHCRIEKNIDHDTTIKYNYICER